MKTIINICFMSCLAVLGTKLIAKKKQEKEIQPKYKYYRK